MPSTERPMKRHFRGKATTGEQTLSDSSAAEIPQDTRIAVIMVPEQTTHQFPEAAAGHLSRYVLFYDPFSSETDQPDRERIRRKGRRDLGTPKYFDKPDRRHLMHAKALEAVSRDLAMLASRASTESAPTL